MGIELGHFVDVGAAHEGLVARAPDNDGPGVVLHPRQRVGELGYVGGQEDMIIDVALSILDERRHGLAPEPVTDDRAGIDALAAGSAL